MKTLIVWLVVLTVFFGLAGAFMTQMPGTPMTGKAPPVTDEEEHLAGVLADHVAALTDGGRSRGSHSPEGTNQALGHFETQLRRMGYDVTQHTFDSRRGTAVNLEATRLGTNKKGEFVVLAAHYDCEARSPGADANASGCAALLEVARIVSEQPSDRSFRFVFLANGSESWIGDDRSGAAAYARELTRRGEKAVLAFVFDGLGYYRDTPGSQSVPFPFQLAYPDTADFVLFAGDLGSRDFVRESIATFRAHARFPSQGIAVPSFFPGYASSDHAAFAAAGIRSVLVTDTGRLRYPASNTPGDLPATLDYPRLARVTIGLARVVTALSKSPSLL